MRVTLEQTHAAWTAEVRDRDNFNELVVVMPTGAVAGECAGVRVDGSSAWVDVDWLARKAGCRAGGAAAAFAAMMEFARTRHWYSELTGEVEAHVVLEGQE